MQSSGPDSLASWTVAILCFFINAVLLGLSRMSGMLFFASLSRFSVSRERAVFPYTFSIFVQNISSPLALLLCKRFGVRAITIIGCILGAVGAGTCCLAENIAIIIVLWGLIAGVGLGIATAILPGFINRHFDLQKAKASLMLPSGAALGSFILPPILDFLLNVYGLSGLFLLLCGFILNCIPAALLLKDPVSEDYESKFNDSEIIERKSITSEVRVTFHAADDISERSDSSSNDEMAKNIPTIEIEDASNHSLVLTYEEKIERLSTQTLLSDYFVRLSCADALNVDEIIQNSKRRRKIDRNMLETEVLSLGSVDAERDHNVSKDGFMEKRIRFASVQYQRPISPGKFHQKITISSESVVSDTGKNFYEKTCSKQNKKYDYQPNGESSNQSAKLAAPLISVTHQNLSENSEELYIEDDDIYLKCPYNECTVDSRDTSGRTKSPSDSPRRSSKCSETSEKEHFKVRHKILCISPLKDKENDNYSFLKILSIISEPMVLLISFTYAVSNFTLICILIVIVDYVQDLSMHIFYGKHIIMTLSAAELIGLWCLQSITELCMNYVTPTSFVCLCFAFQGIFIAAIVWSSSALLIVFTSFYGLAQAGLITRFPVLIEDYIGRHKLSIAIESSKIINGIFCLAISPLIGYFRDPIGTYDYLFYILSFLSAISCLCWTIVQYRQRFRRQQQFIS